MKVVETPVLIVGGAGCGLSSAIMLAREGIESWLVERYPTTSPAPKAHYLNQRTMEIFRELGIADEIYAKSTPPENMSRVGWYTTLAGDGDLDRKTIAVMDAFGGGDLAEEYRAGSACRAANFPQLRLEPVLCAFANKLPKAHLNYGHELVSFKQDDEGVTAEILDRGADMRYQVRAKYMVAADGGRSVGPALGIEMSGIPRLFDMVTCHFSADLSQWIDDDGVMIRWYLNPEKGGSWGSGVVVALGPDHYDRHSEEWLIHFAFQPDDPEQFDANSVVDRVRDLLRLPELDLRIIRMNNWKVQGVLADRYSEGRVFLAGDAAHRHPPTTGLGLNTAVQDAHNISWKLAQVLRGEAAPSLLGSYEKERRPVGERNVAWAMLTFQNHMAIDAGIGLIPGAPLEVNRGAFHALFADTDMGASRRQRLHEIVRTQRAEFQAHEMEIGFRYTDGAIVPDGAPPLGYSPLGDHYRPTTRPGHRLPHAWLSRGGKDMSTHDLVGRGRYTLFVGRDGKEWCDAAASLPNLAVVAIGDGQTYSDRDGTWTGVREIGDDGALLVRPDGHVAARWTSADDGRQKLGAAMATILGTSVKIAEPILA